MRPMVSCALMAFALLAALVQAGLAGRAAAQGESTPPAQDAGSNHLQVNVGDIEVAYRVLGEGAPLIMIMGYSGTMDLWDPDVLDALATHYQVITFDNRGMGGTTAGSKDFTIEQFADDTAGFMEALGVARAQVLAWSMGTNVAVELALRHPDRVDRLILYAADPGGTESIPATDDVLQRLTDTSGTAEERGMRLLELLLPTEWLKEHAETIQKMFYRPMEPVSPESVAKQATAIAAWRGCYDRLAEIKSPTMLITGTLDVITPPGNSMKMVQQMPDAWLVQLRGGGHGAMYQYPQQLSQIVIDFLAAP
jgi:pimeloyl-ACP methyl ester carboxylesterase